MLGIEKGVGTVGVAIVGVGVTVVVDICMICDCMTRELMVLLIFNNPGYTAEQAKIYIHAFQQAQAQILATQNMLQTHVQPLTSPSQSQSQSQHQSQPPASPSIKVQTPIKPQPPLQPMQPPPQAFRPQPISNGFHSVTSSPSSSTPSSPATIASTINKHSPSMLPPSASAKCIIIHSAH